MDLKGKHAFITGGANGIGKAYCHALLERGVKVSFSDLSERSGKITLQEFQTQLGFDAVRFYPFDVTDHNKFEDAFDQAVKTFGRVDIMINNAGIMNEGAWLKMIDINVTSVVKGVKLAESVMRRDLGGQGGRVINISSCAGLGPSPFVPIYAGTKHFVRAYTTSLARQCNIEERGIQFAQICPDPVDTDMVKSIDAVKINYFDIVREDFKNTIPPSRCVEAMLQLLSLDNMNGAILYAKKDELVYQSVERKDIGVTWNPTLAN